MSRWVITGTTFVVDEPDMPSQFVAGIESNGNLKVEITQGEPENPNPKDRWGSELVFHLTDREALLLADFIKSNIKNSEG